MRTLSLLDWRLWQRKAFYKSRSKFEVEVARSKIMVPCEGHVTRNTMWNMNSGKVIIRRKVWQTCGSSDWRTDGRMGGRTERQVTDTVIPSGVLLRCRHKNWWTFLVNKVMIFRIRVQNHQKNAWLLYFQDGKIYGRLFIKMINYFSVKIWIFEISKITFIKIFSLQIVNLTIRYHLLKFLYITISWKAHSFVEKFIALLFIGFTLNFCRVYKHVCQIIYFLKYAACILR